VTDPRDERITELEALVAAKDARIAELEKKVEDLTQLVLMLKERLDRNSGNSSKPPSSDSPDQRAERRGKGPTGGKRGGQFGHPGSKRDLLPKVQVNEFKPLFPS
jgi:transposase